MHVVARAKIRLVIKEWVQTGTSGSKRRGTNARNQSYLDALLYLV